MKVERALQASDLLFGLWIQGRTIGNLPMDLRPATRTEAYEVQQLLEEKSASPLYGWKIAATSPAGQAHIAVKQPLAGRILRERVIAKGDLCPFGANRMRVAELEFAFRMAKDLLPRDNDYSVPEVLDAVDSLHPAIEIPDSRFEPFEEAGEAQLIADNACAHYFVEGEAAPAIWRSIDLAEHPVTGRLNGGPPLPGIGSNVLGDPRIALAWLVNELSHHNIALRAGHIVTTGTCVVPIAISQGDHIYGDFGPLGNVEVTMKRS